jgi:hypothetical protein
MKKILLILLLFAVSCSSPDKPVVYDMQGYVEDVRIDSEGAFINILVNGKMETQEGPIMIDYGWATINQNTTIFLNNEEIEFYPFKPDTTITVLVKYDGAIMESYPVQGTAKIVLINDN